MKIETKFDKGDNLVTLSDNKVLGVIVKNIHVDVIDEIPHITYDVLNNRERTFVFKESELFESREELFATL